MTAVRFWASYRCDLRDDRRRGRAKNSLASELAWQAMNLVPDLPVNSIVAVEEDEPALA
jgi:hypothetical protein